jgi:hypothetical protein
MSSIEQDNRSLEQDGIHEEGREETPRHMSPSQAGPNYGTHVCSAFLS